MKDVYLDERLFKQVKKREINIRKREEYELEKLKLAEKDTLQELKEERKK